MISQVWLLLIHSIVPPQLLLFSPVYPLHCVRSAYNGWFIVNVTFFGWDFVCPCSCENNNFLLTFSTNCTGKLKYFFVLISYWSEKEVVFGLIINEEKIVKLTDCFYFHLQHSGRFTCSQNLFLTKAESPVTHIPSIDWFFVARLDIFIKNSSIVFKSSYLMFVSWCQMLFLVMPYVRSC